MRIGVTFLRWRAVIAALRRDRWEWLGAALLFIAGMLMAHWPMWRSGFSLVQTDNGDPRLINYLLEHSYRWLLREPGHLALWDPPFFYPHQNVLAYSDTQLGAAPLYWFARLLGLAPDSAFQAWLVLLSVFNFTSMFVLLRRIFSVRVFAAGAGAWLFAFASPRIAQLSHPQLMTGFLTVGAIYLISRSFSAGPEPLEKSHHYRLAAAAVLFAAQFYASYYLGWFFMLALALALGFALVRPALRAGLLAYMRSCRTPLLAAFLLWLLLMIPFLIHYGWALEEAGPRAFAEVKIMIPRLQSWFYSGPSSWLYGGLGKLRWMRRLPVEYRGEHEIALGFATSMIIIAGLWSRRKERAGGLIFFTAAALFICFTSLIGLTKIPWRLFYEIVPGASALRAVSRIVLFLLIPAAIGFAWFWERALAHRKYAWLVLLPFCMLEQGRTTPAYDKAENRAVISGIKRALPPGCGALLLRGDLSLNRPFWAVHIDAMWAGLEAGIPVINGYSGNGPPGWGMNETIMPSPTNDKLLNVALRDWVKRHPELRGRVCILGAATK